MKSGWIYSVSNRGTRKTAFELRKMQPDDVLYVPVVVKSPDIGAFLDKAIRDLVTLFETSCPKTILSELYFYFLGKTFDEWGRKNAYTHGEHELALAVALRSPWPHRPSPPDSACRHELGNGEVLFSRCLDVEPFAGQIKLVKDAFLAYNDKSLCDINGIEEVDQDEASYLQLQARRQSLLVRNWATPD